MPRPGCRLRRFPHPQRQQVPDLVDVGHELFVLFFKDRVALVHEIEDFELNFTKDWRNQRMTTVTQVAEYKYDEWLTRSANGEVFAPFIDPMFSNLNSDDFTIRSNSLCYGKGGRIERVLRNSVSSTYH